MDRRRDKLLGVYTDIVKRKLLSIFLTSGQVFSLLPSTARPTNQHINHLHIIHLDSHVTHLEPINGAAVDERGELAQSVSERVTNRGERDDDVEILPAPVHKEGKQGQGREVCVLIPGLGYWSYSLQKEGKERLLGLNP